MGLDQIIQFAWEARPLRVVLLFLAAALLLEALGRLRNDRLQRLLVAGISCALMSYFDWRSTLLLVVLSGVIFIAVRRRVDLKPHAPKVFLVLLFTLIFLKDYWLVFHVERVYVPLGVSYYFFRLISFVVEYSKKQESVSETSFVDYLSWVFFFPVILAGPILRFHNFKRLDPQRRTVMRASLLSRGVLALAAKIVLVDTVLRSLVYDTLYSQMTLEPVPLPFLTGCTFGFLALVHAYLDLMLYTEISKSAAGLLGFTNQENFNRPLLARNISQFWQRWHMSLSDWTRDYVFFPLLLKTRSTYLATYASMLTIGVWHSATPNWLVWAVLHATAINVYGTFRERRLLPTFPHNSLGDIGVRWVGNLLTIGFVSLVFVFVAVDDFSLALTVLARTLGLESS